MRITVVQEAIEARLTMWFPDPQEVQASLAELMQDIREATAGRKTEAQKAAHRSYMRKYMAARRRAEVQSKG